MMTGTVLGLFYKFSILVLTNNTMRYFIIIIPIFTGEAHATWRLNASPGYKLVLGRAGTQLGKLIRQSYSRVLLILSFATPLIAVMVVLFWPPCC